MRLIDADALIEKMFKEADAYTNDDVRKGYHNCECLVYDAPTVDAVEVVRCKDCTHYGFTDNRVPKEQVWWCYKWSNVMRENDFCSYGEKNNETDRRRRTT